MNKVTKQKNGGGAVKLMGSDKSQNINNRIIIISFLQKILPEFAVSLHIRINESFDIQKKLLIVITLGKGLLVKQA